MKKTLCLLLFATSIAIANATGTPNIKMNAAEPSATLQKMWVDYNAIEDGRAGMMMHLDFTVYNMKGKECFLGLYFQYNNGKPENWIKFPGKYDKYHATDGTLHRGVTYTPSYDEAVYKDIQLFMPYDEIKLNPGTYDLAISPQVAIKNGKNIAWFDLYEFEFNKAVFPALI